MDHHGEIEIEVLDRLLVTIAYTVCDAEPDVGIMSSYVYDWCITDISTKSANRTYAETHAIIAFIHDILSPEDDDAICETILDEHDWG